MLRSVTALGRHTEANLKCCFVVRCEGGSKEQLLGISKAPCNDFEGKTLGDHSDFTWRQVLSGWHAQSIRIPLDLPPLQVISPFMIRPFCAREFMIRPLCARDT